MNHPITFGVVGGYGLSGSTVVSELWKSSRDSILIGGRDLGKAQALAAHFDNRVTTAPLDILDPKSLDEFCSQCDIILNCAGPVSLLQDHVAQAALRARCHYVDPAGLTFVSERLVPHSQKIADLSLSFVVSAGWMPGLTELLPAYVYAQSKLRMDSIDSLSVYFGDSGTWSASALRDAVFYVRQRGLRRPTYFHKGQRTPAKMSSGFRKIEIDKQLGTLQFSMMSMPEQDEMARRFADCDVVTYAYVPSMKMLLAGSLIALLPLSEATAVDLLGSAWRKNNLPVGGFVVVRAAGQTHGQSVESTSRIVFEKGQDYWINGLVMANVARVLAEGNDVRKGVHYLSDAVEPAAFLAALRAAGLNQTDRL
jgi:hypothetical protein